MTPFTIERNDDLPLEFDGEILAEVSSRQGSGQGRWTEIRIYRTDTGRYVTEMVACSDHPGESDRAHVQVFDAADEISRGLQRRDGARRYMTNIAQHAMREAARKDDAIADALVERI